MSSNSILSFLTQRASVPAAALTEPAPSEFALEQAFTAAMTAPDHKALRPWRFIIIAHQQRESLGQLIVEASLAMDESLSDEKQAKLTQKPLRAPLIVAVVLHYQAHPKVPKSEQLMTTGIAAYNFMLALQAQQYGSVWLSGHYTNHPVLHHGLGLSVHEELQGFIYCGTSSIALETLQKGRASMRPDIKQHVREWQTASNKG